MENYEVQEQGNEEDTQELHPYIAEYMANVEQLGNNEMASSHDNRHLLSYSELRVFKNEKGEIIYEREFPLSNEYYTLTEEAFENEILHINKNLQTKKKEAEEQRDLHDKLINTGCKNIGFMYNGIYGQHLLDTLKKHEVNTIQTIPQHIENQVLLTTRNQELTKLKKNPDHYEEIIHNWLEEKEQTVERRWIKNEEIQGIETIFLQGHIDNLELFYRFEQLKQKNRIEDIKRGYVYGRRCGVCSEVTNETKTMDFIGGASFHSIFVHFHHNKGNIQQELGVSKEQFKERILYSYKKRMGIQRLRHSPTDEDKYSYSKRKIQALLHLTDEEILRLQKQSKEMVTEIFEEELKTDTLEERILRDANSSPWERMVMTIHNIKNHVVGIEQIKELGKDTPEFNERVQQYCKQQIIAGIQKIINKERFTPLNNSTIDKKVLSYKRYIKHITTNISKFFSVLQIIDPQEAEATGREQNRATYIQEYIDFFKKGFIQKRLQEVLTTPEDQELIPQLIQHSKTKLYQLLFQKLKKNITIVPGSRHPITDYQAKIYINEAIFKTGYALALKNAYSRKKERGKIYQQCVQEICKQLLQEIETKLLSTEDFSDISIKESFMIAPLSYLYKEYKGKEELEVNTQVIREKYYEKIIESFKETCTKNLKKMQNSLKNKKNSKSPYELYGILSGSVREIHYYTQYFINTPRDQIVTDKEREIDMGLYLEYDEKIKNSLPPEIQEIYQHFFDQIDIYRKDILQRIIQLRSQQNFRGRLKRIIEDHLLKEFGTTIITHEQHIEYILGILDKILEEIVLQDLSQQFKGGIFLREDREIMKEYIKESLNILSQQKHLPGVFLKFLQ